MIGDETREADEPGIEIRAEAQRSGDHPFAPPSRGMPRDQYASTRRNACIASMSNSAFSVEKRGAGVDEANS
ncbi:hypothetical protein X961_1460 [Burkholderia pseudomallei MSHR5613]|nr:hypothetical protein X961_1460 [Burkholderia pseudomallei MSHR5613]KGV28072.1 hypothetical protein X894_5125 [Burkholderia pseudomallei MSHR4462]KGX00315.1 hypothetical protein Y601_1797 [Burkholderia pseudomallei MSHR640]